MNNILLSICIPTYNRAPLLQEGLQAIIGQLDESSIPQIEIAISDNASTDNTGQIVQDLVDQNPKILIRYFRRPMNTGGNENFLNLIKIAHGKFIYLVSDDDVLLPNALQKILTKIQTVQNVDVICPNGKLFLNTVDDISNPNNSTIQLTEDVLTNDKNILIQTLGTWVTFISCLIIRRALIPDFDYTPKISTSIPHSYVFIDVLNRARVFLLIKDACLAVKINNEVNYKFLEIFGTNFHRLLEYAVSTGFDSKSIHLVARRHVSFIADNIYNFRRQNTYAPSSSGLLNDIKRLWNIYGCKYCGAFLYTALILVLPVRFIRYIRYAWNKLS